MGIKGNMWLTLHIVNTDEEVHINSNYIMAIRQDKYGTTVVELPGSDEYYYLVKESPEEIMQQLWVIR